ncbi:Aldose 1-epimerase [Furfurilactobacillus rossiae]|uniref:aldose epimerase family protein n=1 Tax=Furfurilactobacillus rossiae TaxID=231049 RepID=UPI0015BD1F96|nr:aldose epimerase family protein [Furfurilactobacillus rossiae]MCF6166487.1 galactose mutarotase [Furfurilactobacillus rossiae]QLE64711.1 Aldose 1-epimerase [Furfurilactobacillus rossiae]
MNFSQQPFGKLSDGRSVDQLILSNDNQVSLRVLTLGATWQGFDVPDGNNRKNLLISYDQLKDYEATPFYVCKTVGRVAGRIGQATYDIDGTSYHSDQNENKNTLHGGLHGFSDRVWRVVGHQETSDTVSVTLGISVQGSEDNFPGDMDVLVTYSLTNANRATWSITGTATAKTLFNPTLHTYFNVTDNEALTTQQLHINGKQRVLLNSEKVPTGELSDATGTAYDFSKTGTVTDHLAQLKEENGGKEFDDAYRVNGDEHTPIATVSDPASGRAVDLYSSRNGLVIFTADPLAYDKDEAYQASHPYTALAMEAQWLPDAIHHDGFGDVVLPANAPQTYSISYQYREMK